METSYRESIISKSAIVSEEIQTLLGLSDDQYLELKYELSFVWITRFNHYNAQRMFAISSVFYQWWFQSVAWREHEMLMKLRNTKSGRKELYTEYITSIPIYPPLVVCNRIINEGLKLVSQNPQLNEIRL